MDFRDFLEKHLHFLMDISKYSQNATRQYYQILFYRKSSHTAIYIALCGKIKLYIKTSDFTVSDLTQYPTSRSAAGYVGFVSQLTQGIDPMAE